MEFVGRVGRTRFLDISSTVPKVTLNMHTELRFEIFVKKFNFRPNVTIGQLKFVTVNECHTIFLQMYYFGIF